MKFKITRYKHSLDELVFEGRNKNYGAYTLRKAYEKRINFATLTICISAIVITLGYFFYLSSREPEQREIDLTQYDGFDLRMNQHILPELPKGEKPKEKEKPKKKEKDKPKENKDKPKAKTEIVKKADKPDFTKLSNNVQDSIKLDTLAKNGLSKTDSTIASNLAESKRLDSLNGLNGSSNNKNTMLLNNRHGGIEEFIAWVQQNFVYPKTNRYQYDCTIYVYFCINPDGSLQDITITKPVTNKEYNDEVLRVVKSSPAFKANINNTNCTRTQVAIKIPATPKIKPANN